MNKESAGRGVSDILFAAFAAVSLAALCLSACATKPKAASLAPESGIEAPPSFTALEPRAKSDTVPDLSMTRRIPFDARLIIAALPEPLPPVKKVETKAATQPEAAATQKPPPAAAATQKPTPQAAAQKPAASPPVAAPKPAPAATPKAESVEPVPKSLPPTPGSTAIIIDPKAEAESPVTRSVLAVQGSRVELPFEGGGWTYLGEKNGKEGLGYESRRTDGRATVFTLNAAKPGDYLLRFQRQDALRGLVYDELVELKVSPKTAESGAAASAPQDQSRIIDPASAPRVTDFAAASAATSSALDTKAESSTSISSEKILQTPESILAAAKNEFGAGKIHSGIQALDRFLSLYPSGGDEVFFLYAKALEQNGPLKDIKRALAYYRKVRDEYPMSQYWEEAARRVTYIERHYFDIR